MPNTKSKVERLVLRVELDYTDPVIWRKISVPSDCTLGELHDVIQVAFGWENSHLHEFEFKKRRFSTTDMPDDLIGFGDVIEDENSISVGKLLTRKGSKLRYTYDFGDNWTHTIVREEVDSKGGSLPAVLDGELACPPEDCGGVYGYYQMLDAIDDEEHPDHDHYVEWIGPVDETSFDAQQANRTLQKWFK